MDLQQLLVIIDPTSEDSQPSLERASWFARKTNAAVELLVCEYNSALDGGFFFDGPAQQKARDSLLNNRIKWLETLAAPLRADGITVTTKARWGKPIHRQIIEHANELKPDIIFREAHKHGILQRLLFNNISWQLIRYCPVPLWLVRSDKAWQGERITTAIDPLHAADKPAILDHKLVSMACKLADKLGMKADFIHSYAPLPRTMVFDAELVAAYDDFLARSKDQHKAACTALLNQYPIAEEEKYLLEGFPEHTIPEHTQDKNTDLLIMGAISRTNLQNIMIGSTAERVFESTDCDLLVIKPDGIK